MGGLIGKAKIAGMMMPSIMMVSVNWISKMSQIIAVNVNWILRIPQIMTVQTQKMRKFVSSRTEHRKYYC